MENWSKYKLSFVTKKQKKSIIYPLLSITSTGSSRICVTLGRVSSALSTGKVLDKKSSVRFRMSSLKWNCKQIIYELGQFESVLMVPTHNGYGSPKTFCPIGFLGICPLFKSPQIL